MDFINNVINKLEKETDPNENHSLLTLFYCFEWFFFRR